MLFSSHSPLCQGQCNNMHSYFSPTKYKCSMCILDHMHGTFFCLGKFLKKLADNECSSITKGSIYYIKHMYIQPFSMEVDWPEIWRWMEVSTMFNICIYCVFTLYGRVDIKWMVLPWTVTSASFDIFLPKLFDRLHWYVPSSLSCMLLRCKIFVICFILPTCSSLISTLGLGESSSSRNSWKLKSAWNKRDQRIRIKNPILSVWCKIFVVFFSHLNHLLS